MFPDLVDPPIIVRIILHSLDFVPQLAQESDLARCQLGMYKVEQKHNSSPIAFVPRFVEERVVKNKALSLVPRPDLAADPHSAMVRDH